ncbi:MAG: VCBS repeat-containing protein [Flavobacteriales bacterium]|nr:VCBS repeat-containing protein [Flavobacteriales bacterium]
MKKIYFILAAMCVTSALSAQSFTMSNGLLPSTYHSGGCVGVTDMNSDGYDDIIVLDQSLDLYVLYQQSDGTFDEYDYGTLSNEQAWGMCMADVDNDGHIDVFSGGYYDGVNLVNIDAPGDYTSGLLDADYDIFMQGCNLADINNDGWLDAFACHDDGESHMWKNDGAGTLMADQTMIDYTIYAGSDNSGNYGSVWTDFDRDGDLDCFIAKCRQFIGDPYDPRRTNILLVNDGNNNYHDEAHERGLVNLQQSWTSDFADVDNDGDFDCLITTHSATLQLYENNGYGYFTNVTAGSGLEVSGFFLQAKLADLDNDGFVDLIHSGGDHAYYRNNGDMTFTEVDGMFENNDTMHSFGIGDLNKDGYLDVYASYGDGYVDADNAHQDRVFINGGGDNHFIAFDLEGTVSNKDAVGALVEIHGPWGIQLREVRAGESYGITNSFVTHFGIGANTEVELAIIHWPSGLVTVIENPTVDTWHDVVEAECTAPDASIFANGNTTICPGQTVTLEIEEAVGNYIWSNGASTESIEVSGGGNYSLIVWDSEGCAGTSNEIQVIVTPDPEPVVTISGDVEFCEGGSVQLIASEGDEFEWSNGSTSQAVTITQTGDYHVSITGACSTMDSEPVHVEVFDAPEVPVVDDIVLEEYGTATFTTTGNDVRWYDSEDAVTPVGTGNSFTTPTIYANTSYWVEDAIVHGGEMAEGGKLINEDGQYHNSPNYNLRFDAHEDIILESVKVFANGEGSRTIEVVDEGGNVVATGSFLIPNGESVVALGFSVPEGEGYGLRCTNTNPQLWRDRNVDVDAPYDYPYELGALATITGTNVQGDDFDNYYYFFYDWTVSTPVFDCTSDREEVQVTLLGTEEISGVQSFNVYPNPASELLNVQVQLMSAKKVQIRLMDATGRIVLEQEAGTVAAGARTWQINIAALAPGMYQLESAFNGAIRTDKIVVE